MQEQPRDEFNRKLLLCIAYPIQLVNIQPLKLISCVEHTDNWVWQEWKPSNLENLFKLYRSWLPLKKWEWNKEEKKGWNKAPVDSTESSRIHIETEQTVGVLVCLLCMKAACSAQYCPLSQHNFFFFFFSTVWPMCILPLASFSTWTLSNKLIADAMLTFCNPSPLFTYQKDISRNNCPIHLSRDNKILLLKGRCHCPSFLGHVKLSLKWIDNLPDTMRSCAN